MADEVLTPDQRAEFLGALRQGIAPGLAARGISVGEGEPSFTGTKLRALRNRDPVFGAECAAALLEGQEAYQERLSAAARLRALDDDRRSDRLLEVELATHVPGYEHLRRDRIQANVHVEGAIVLDPGWLETLPTDDLLQLRAILSRGVSPDVIDAEYRELPAATSNGG